jgi:hypothetical protein
MADGESNTYHPSGKRAGAIYFIEADGLGRVKIGSAKDPAKRLKELQTGSPARLRILATIQTDDPRRLEHRLHKTFMDARILGEWFHATRTLTRIIDAAAGIPTEIDYRRLSERPTVRLWPPADADIDALSDGMCDLMEMVGVPIERDA